MTYSADVFIDAKTLDWATQKGCPEIFTDYDSGILVKALGIDGTANVFCKSISGKYNLSWILQNGDEYISTFSEEELLRALKDKTIEENIQVNENEKCRNNEIYENENERS